MPGSTVGGLAAVVVRCRDAGVRALVSVGRILKWGKAKLQPFPVPRSTTMIRTFGLVLAVWLAAPADVDCAWPRRAGSAEGASSMAAGSEAQARAVGYVRGRNGVGLAGCQLDFYVNGQGQAAYRVYTDQGGMFFIDSPRSGSYSVKVVQGGRSHQINVTIQGRTISPNTLVVPW